MTTLSRKLARLESLASPTPRVWIEDLDDAGTVVCIRTGERIAVEDARRLGDGDIVVRYARAERWMGPWREQRVKDLRAQGLTDVQIRDAVIREIAAMGGIDAEKLRGEAERISALGVPSAKRSGA